MSHPRNLASACAFTAAAVTILGFIMHFVLRYVMLRSFEVPPLGYPALTTAIYAIAAVRVAAESIALWTIGDQRRAAAPLPARLGQWSVAERQGDFSQSLNAVGGLRTIYNPFSTETSADGRTVTRTPFPGNIIPASRIDPISAQYMAGLWNPTVPARGPLQHQQLLCPAARR